MGFVIRGTNFQAWENFEVGVSGLTVLIGDSNEGKSSLSRALRGLVRNELGAHFVRHGTKKLEVSLAIDGKTIAASRTRSGSTKYLVNGEDKFESVGRDIPQPVQDLAMGEIEIGKESIDPVFARQGSAQFMLEESASALNAVLGAFSSTERLEAGKSEAKGRIGELNREAGLLAGQLRQAEEVRAKLVALDERAQAIASAIDDMTPEIARQENAAQVLAELIERRTRLDRLKGLINRLAVPDTGKTEHSLRTATSLSQLISARVRHTRLRGFVEKLATPDVGALLVQVEVIRLLGLVPPARRLLILNKAAFAKSEETVTTWTELVAQHKLAKTLSTALDQIAVRDNSTATTFAGRLEKIQGAVENNQAAAVQQYRRLTVLSALIQANEAKVSLTTKVGALVVAIDGEQERIGKVQAELDTARAEEYRRAHQVTCPGCGENFIPDSTGEHTHAHVSIVGK